MRILPDWLKGSLFVLFGAFLWGTLVTISKGAAQIPPLTIAFMRVVLASLGCLVWFGIRNPSILKIKMKDAAWLFVYGCVATSFTYGGFTVALRHLSVAACEVIFYTFPLFAALGSAVFLKERPTVTQIVSGLTLLFGVFCMAALTETPHEEAYPLIGLVTVGLSVFGITVQSLVGRWNGKAGYMPAWSLFCWAQFSAVFWIGLAKTIFEGWGDMASISGPSWLVLAYLGFVATILGYGMYNYGLRWVSAPTGSLLASFELVTAVILSAAVLGNIPSFGEVLGCAIVLFALALSAWSARASGA